MVVYYGDDTGGYAGHVNAPNYSAYHDPADNHLPPWYGGPYNASTANLRPDVEVRRGDGGGARHRSLPPPARRGSTRRRRDRSPPMDPVQRAQSAIKDAFTKSTSGVGVGVLGAIIGGLVAREASDAAVTSSSSSKITPGHGGGRGRSGNYHHSRKRAPAEMERTRLISTLVGAAVGGFGANALEKRIEVARERTAEKEETWERKWGKDSRGRRVDRMEDYDDSDEDGGRRRSQRRYKRDMYA